MLSSIYSAMSKQKPAVRKNNEHFGNWSCTSETLAHISMQGPHNGKKHWERWVQSEFCLLSGPAVSLLQFPGTSDQTNQQYQVILTLPSSRVPVPKPRVWDKSEDRSSCVMSQCVNLTSNFFSAKLRNSTLRSLPLSPFWFLTDEITLLSDLSSVRNKLSLPSNRPQRQERWLYEASCGDWNAISFR